MRGLGQKWVLDSWSYAHLFARHSWVSISGGAEDEVVEYGGVGGDADAGADHHRHLELVPILWRINSSAVRNTLSTFWELGVRVIFPARIHFPGFHHRRDPAAGSWVSLSPPPHSHLHCCCRGYGVFKWYCLAFSWKNLFGFLMNFHNNWYLTLYFRCCWRRWRRGRSSSWVSRSRGRAPWCGWTGSPRGERWLSSGCGTLQVKVCLSVIL